MQLATNAEYLEVYSASNVDSNIISNALTWISESLEDYCDRKFESQTYSEWFIQPTCADNNKLLLTQYPVSKVLLVSTPFAAANITVDTDNLSSVIVYSNASGKYMDLSIYDTNGDEQITVIPLATNKTLSALETVVEVGNVFSMRVEAGYENYPTGYIRDMIGSTSDVTTYIDVPQKNSLKAELKSERILLMDGASGQIFVKYIAGYTLGDSGNVPKDLKLAVINAAHDLINLSASSTNSMGVDSSLIKSESLGDYSYAKFDNAQTYQVIQNYSSTFNQYKRISF